ncbi:MAG: hypoxanthine phosphoribosyltransferase [Flavobacteriia bacterium]|nr:hypoxanthine phosphoribosyltransferase [Flavobacteriia bacterium]
MIQIHDKNFIPFIDKPQIQNKICEIGRELSNNYQGHELVFISILNGSFMFASDLMKQITIPCEISFVKVKSYQGTSSTERVDELIGLNTNIEKKSVVILEDIVDTGITMNKVYSYLNSFNPSSLKICSLLFKPEAFKGKHKPDFVGFTIPNKFVVGFGLDYNEKGRNLEDIYQLKE